MRKLLLAATIALSVAACNPAPVCIQSHVQQKTGYHYGYGWSNQCRTTYYNKKSQYTCSYGYGYGYVYGSYTETVCDVYASPDTKNEN